MEFLSLISAAIAIVMAYGTCNESENQNRYKKHVFINLAYYLYVCMYKLNYIKVKFPSVSFFLCYNFLWSFCVGGIRSVTIDRRVNPLPYVILQMVQIAAV